MAANSQKLTGKAREVAAAVCATRGHNLVSFPLSPLVDRKEITEKTTTMAPTTATALQITGVDQKQFPAITLIPQFEVRCSQCALTPKEIEGLRDREKKGKAATAEPVEVPSAGN